MNNVYIIMLGVVDSTEKWVGSLFFKSYKQAEEYITTVGNFIHINDNYYEENNGTEIVTAYIIELDSLEDAEE